MLTMPKTLPDDPILLKQLLLAASAQMSEKDKAITAKDGQIEHLREQNALLLQRLFGRKSEQSPDPDSPQLAMFNEAESLADPATAEAADDAEEGVAPLKRRGKRKRATYRARPYMGPAFEKEQPKLPAMWRDSVR